MYRGLLFVMCLYWDFLVIIYLTGVSYYAPLQGLLVYMCLYKGLLSYLLFFKSVKFFLRSPISGNYVFEPIGLLHFKCVLDSFANCPKGHQSVLEY